MSDDESTLTTKFRECEKAIHDFEADDIDSMALKPIIETLLTLEKHVDRLDFFSTNEQFEEFPSSSLQFLLIPAYLGLAIENVPAELDLRAQHLRTARTWFRRFLERLLLFGVISFKLPFLDEDGEAIPDPEEAELPQRNHEVRRTERIRRAEARKNLEMALEKLQIERKRNNDESTMRELYIVQLRLWAIKAVSELDSIAEELPLAEHMIKVRSGAATHTPAKKPPSLPPFIITKDEQQRKVFGLGYPSIPSYSVDQWYESMQQSGRFGDMSKPNVVHIDGQDGGGDDDVPGSDEDESEEARQKKIIFDDYKDTHRRGWGNTHGKG
uniref:Immunoglobulin-binding protein 1 n=1 Tax=Panagrellus redivivus TaxID=6233 RepID=A0A7E4VJG5_PANRE